MRRGLDTLKTEDMAKTLVRYGYVPLMLIGINGAAIGLAHAPC